MTERTPHYPLCRLLGKVLLIGLPLFVAIASIFPSTVRAAGLEFSTFLGGSFTDSVKGAAVDSSGNIYVTGWTLSRNLPTTAGAYQLTFSGSGNYNGYAAKLNPTGTAILWMTYLGSARPYAITVSPSGNLYIVGTGTNLTTTGTVNTATGWGEVFVAKMNTNTGSRTWSARIGGNFDDTPHSVAADINDNIYVAGTTTSAGSGQNGPCSNGSTNNPFPTPNGFQTANTGYSHTVVNSSTGACSPGNNNSEGFLVKLNSSGTQILYGSLLGGSFVDRVFGMVADSNGKAYIIGSTNSSNFPTTSGAYDTTAGGFDDCFVLKVDTNQSGSSSLIYSTYIGGPNTDQGEAIAGPDANGNVYLTGTAGSGFPTTGGVFGSTSQSSDAFAVKLSPDGANLVYSTIFGGTSSDKGAAIALDSSGNTYITGTTNSIDLALTGDAVQSYPGNIFLTNTHDVFLAKIDPTASNLLFLTYLGGNGVDDGISLVLGAADIPIIAGNTTSVTFPITSSAVDITPGGDIDGFVTKFNLSTPTPPNPQLSYAISGIVKTNAGVPIAGATLNADTQGANVSDLLGGDGTLGSATSDANGNYTILNVPYGSNFIIRTTKLGYVFAPPTSIGVINGDLTRNFIGVTTPYNTVSGQITGSFVPGGIDIILNGLGPVATTDGGGNYSFVVAPGTTYTIYPSFGGFAFTPSSTTGTANTNKTHNFTVAFSSSLYTLTGQITISGAALSGVVVDSSNPSLGSAITNTSGNYSFAGVPVSSDFNLVPELSGYVFTPANSNGVVTAATTRDFTAALAPSPSPSASPVPSTSPSSTPSPSPSASPSTTPSAAPSASSSPIPSASASTSPAASPSSSPVASPSASPSRSPTPSPSPAASASSTPAASPSSTPSAAPSASSSPIPSASASTSPAASPSSSPVASPSASPSRSPTPSPSPAASASSTPSAAPSASSSPIPSASASTSPAASPSSSPAASPSASASLAPSPSGTPAALPSPSASPIAIPSLDPQSIPEQVKLSAKPKGKRNPVLNVTLTTLSGIGQPVTNLSSNCYYGFYASLNKKSLGSFLGATNITLKSSKFSVKALPLATPGRRTFVKVYFVVKLLCVSPDNTVTTDLTSNQSKFNIINKSQFAKIKKLLKKAVKKLVT